MKRGRPKKYKKEFYFKDSKDLKLENKTLIKILYDDKQFAEQMIIESKIPMKNLSIFEKIYIKIKSWVITILNLPEIIKVVKNG